MNLNAEIRRIELGSHQQDPGTALHVGYGVDQNFLMPAGVSMVSLLENNPGQAFVFHILLPDIDDASIEKFRMLSQSYASVRIVIHVIDTTLLTGFPTSRNYTIAAYYRFFFPFLAAEASRLLYLDADIVCLGNVQSLCALDMGDNLIAACEDKSSRPEDPAFNSGFLWIQADAWREQRVSERCIDYIHHSVKRVFYDQEALNQTLKGHVKFLPARYNYQMRKQEFEKLPEDVIFLHFSEEKPWRAWYDRRDQIYFLRYKEKSPWHATAPELPRNYQQMKYMAEYCFHQGRRLEGFQFLIG